MSDESARQSSFSAENLKPEYRAFISYRHMDNQEEGRQWASWLHQALETYEVPSELVGQTNELGEPIPERVYPVFRDEEDLPADADLATAICSAVERSQCLIALCSPRSAQSQYVAQEIAYFKQLGRENRILAVLLEGEPNASWDESKHAAGIGPDRECFPLPLMHPVSPEGELDRSVHAEPIASDFRIHPDGGQGWTNPAAYREALNAEGVLSPKAIDEKVKKYEEQLQLGLHKILAGVLAVPLRTLTQKDKAYQLEKARKRARQLRAWLGVTAVLALAALGAAVFATNQKRLADQQKEVAEEQKQAAEEQKQLAEANAEETRKTLYASEIQLALGALQGRDGIKEAKDLLDHWYPKEGTSDLRGWEWFYLLSRLDQSELFLRHPVATKAGDWSPDGQRAYTGDIYGAIRVWDAETGRLLQTLSDHTDQILAIDTSPSGERLASLDRSGILKIHDAASGKVEREWKWAGGGKHQNTELDWSPDGTLLAVSDGPRALVVLNTANGQVVTRFEEPKAILGADWHADGQRLAIATINKPGAQILLWNRGTGETRRFDCPPLAVLEDIRWLPDERIAGAGGTRIYLLDLATSNVTIKGRKEELYQIDVSASTGLMSHGTYEGKVFVSDPKTGETKAVFLGHMEPVFQTFWSPDGSRILSVARDGARIWQTEKKDPESVYKTGAYSLEWRPGGGLTGAYRGGLINLTPPDYRRGVSFKLASELGCHSAWSLDGETVAVATDTHLSLWEWGGQHPLWQVPLKENGRIALGRLLWEPGGERLVYGGLNNPTYSVYSARDGTMLRKWDAAQDFQVFSWHPQGRLLALHRGNGQVTVTDAASGNNVEEWKVKHRVKELAWHPSGDLLATGRHNDFLIELWKMPGAKKVGEVKMGSLILSMAWSPDGRLLAVGSSDGAVRLWDVQHERIVLTVREADVGSNLMTWDDTGTRLAYMTGRLNPQVKVLDAGRGYLAENEPKALPWLDQLIEAHPDRLSLRAKRARLLEALGRDGKATLSEHTKFREGHFRQLDKNWDGFWSENEIDGYENQQPSTPAPAPRETTPEEQAAAARKRQERLKYFNRFGRNSDGNVTRAGYIKFFTDLFSSQDRDGSGTLNAAEFSHPSFEYMDTDGDGKATLSEHAKFREGHFRQRDKNGDGFWSQNEIDGYENQQPSTPAPTARELEKPSAKSSVQQAVDAEEVKRVQEAKKILLHMDKDGDKRASWEEYLAQFVTYFESMDKDGDGALTHAEFPRARTNGIDADGDGKATLSEHAKFREGHFRQLDKNGDGFWTLDEI